jgi:hypothetical protein
MEAAVACLPSQLLFGETEEKHEKFKSNLNRGCPEYEKKKLLAF